MRPEPAFSLRWETFPPLSITSTKRGRVYGKPHRAFLFTCDPSEFLSVGHPFHTKFISKKKLGHSLNSSFSLDSVRGQLDKTGWGTPIIDVAFFRSLSNAVPRKGLREIILWQKRVLYWTNDTIRKKENRTRLNCTSTLSGSRFGEYTSNFFK